MFTSKENIQREARDFNMRVIGNLEMSIDGWEDAVLPFVAIKLWQNIRQTWRRLFTEERTNITIYVFECFRLAQTLGDAGRANVQRMHLKIQTLKFECYRIVQNSDR